MVMLDRTKILADIVVINGLIMYVYIICAVFLFFFFLYGIELTILVSSANIAHNSA